MQQLQSRIRASSVQEQGEQRAKLPNILTPTFADWKIISDARAHPQISRRNPLFKFGLIPPKKAATPSSFGNQNPQDFRGLKSEEKSQRMKEIIVEDRVSTTETNNLLQFKSDKRYFQLRNLSVSGPKQKNQLLLECKQLFDNQKKAFEEIMNKNNLYNKYSRVIDKEQSITNQKIMQIFNFYK
ncbi:unnamed protein product (macronuclear) [Paramecium tetraurelia]|uniref:Uncharacterized protein n=1 Tax=Paramecium tetraurelia TaxID=5888 RepID=A0DXX6_PARTE|nr:uncharacterized protein GSPATT00021517001 [Paramecium tetraurelia]CAK87893.1 unnamed protein product [Paramecium tetraurelia]|eukprot:XP_001455290.1 hypothetical protein (macronuclear) [Paramecium tetraurelia strain d4-2]